MKHLKTFENLDQLEKGNYVILERIVDGYRMLFKLINRERKSIAFKNSDIYNYTYYENGIFEYDPSNIYYDCDLNYFFFTEDKPLKILWQGEDEKEAIEIFHMIDTTNKYNL